MTKRGTGVAFMAISSFLISAKYIAAAIFGSGVASWNESLYEAMLNYVGDTLSNFSILTFILGVIYLLWAEYENWVVKTSDQE